MQLSDLAAQDLAAIDAVCLEFESALKAGQPLTVEQAIEQYTASTDGAPDPAVLELLRGELRAVQHELAGAKAARGSGADTVPPRPFGFAAAPSSSSTRWAEGANTVPPDRPPHRPPDRPPDQPLPDGVQGIQSGQTIGPYRIGPVLARGGMGVVFRATDSRLDRPVALKAMGFPHLATDDPKRREFVDRFEREARAVAALSHPNIVELFDVGVAGGTPYAVMELLPGSTLADELARGPMSAEQTRQVGMQIASALATAHAAGVIHRDLKPQNVMLANGGHSGDESVPRVKLVDFGLSRVSDSALGSPAAAATPDSTRSGVILGTPGYMAPEQARGQAATGAADMFSLGCLLYETLFGKPAIPGETPADRLAGTLRGEVQYEQSQCERSRTLCRLITECVDKDPERRPSAGDVFARLRQFDSAAELTSAPFPETESATGPPRGVSRRHVLTTVAGGIVGGVLGAFPPGRADVSLRSIESLAVLTIRRAGTDRDAHQRSGLPLADREITEGDILASALVNELTSVQGLTVLPYRPQTADTPAEFRRLGQELDVDAFLTGTYEVDRRGEKSFWVLYWQLVSARDGRVLDGDRFVSPRSEENPANQLVKQSEVASSVADKIGRFLVTRSQKDGKLDPRAYGCLMKGHAYADADSTAGLLEAIKCFSHAHQEDPRLSEPLAAIAVASLTLAARSNPAEALEYLEKATTSMTKALELDPRSVDGRLAKAMLEWQSLHHFDRAAELFDQLDREGRYNWRVQHQRGLFLAARGQGEEAIDALRTASKLNPMSMLIKTDRCRADWFFNYDTRAIRDATRYRDSMPADNPARMLVTGLLIDIHEFRRDFQSAGRLQGWDAIPTASASYFRRREAFLQRFPYGPFGGMLNRTILELRQGGSGEGQWLGVLNESGALMFPLLLARHPAFFPLRGLPGAADYVPLRPT